MQYFFKTMSNRKRMFSTELKVDEEDEANPFTGTKDPYKILGVEKGCSKEDVKQAFRRYVLKLHPDKSLQWEILNPDEATQASREVIAAKRFFDDFFNRNPSNPSSSSSNTPKENKKPRTNLKPFEFTEEERESFFESCEKRVSRMEELIHSQGIHIKK